MARIFFQIDVFGEDDLLETQFEFDRSLDDEVLHAFELESTEVDGCIPILQRHLSFIKLHTGVNLDLSHQSAFLGRAYELYPGEEDIEEFVLCVSEFNNLPLEIGSLKGVGDDEVLKVLSYGRDSYGRGFSVQEDHVEFIREHSRLEFDLDIHELYVDLTRKKLNDGKYTEPIWVVSAYLRSTEKIVASETLTGVTDKTVRYFFGDEPDASCGFSIFDDEDQIEFLKKYSGIDFIVDKHFAQVDLWRDDEGEEMPASSHWRVVLGNYDDRLYDCAEYSLTEEQEITVNKYFDQFPQYRFKGTVRESDVAFVKELLNVDVDLKTQNAMFRHVSRVLDN